MCYSGFVAGCLAFIGDRRSLGLARAGILFTSFLSSKSYKRFSASVYVHCGDCLKHSLEALKWCETWCAAPSLSEILKCMDSTVLHFTLRISTQIIQEFTICTHEVRKLGIQRVPSKLMTSTISIVVISHTRSLIHTGKILFLLLSLVVHAQYHRA